MGQFAACRFVCWLEGGGSSDMLGGLMQGGGLDCKGVYLVGEERVRWNNAGSLQLICSSDSGFRIKMGS